MKKYIPFFYVIIKSREKKKKKHHYLGINNIIIKNSLWKARARGLEWGAAVIVYQFRFPPPHVQPCFEM